MKSAAFLAVAFHPDAPMVQLDDGFGDGEPESQAVVMPCQSVADLIKAIKDMALLFLRNSQSLVMDAGDNASNVSARGNDNGPLGRGEFDRV